MTFTIQHLPMDRHETITFVEDGIVGQRTILPGGVRVLTEKVPGQRSVSAGFWVSAGSRDEQAGHEGSTHFWSTCCLRALIRRVLLIFLRWVIFWVVR